MNKLLMFLCLMSLTYQGAFAQKKKEEVVDLTPAPTMIDNEKGNGGNTYSINSYGLERDLERVRQDLIYFLRSKSGKDLFENVVLDETIKLLEDDSTFSIVTTMLRDKFLISRDALNFPSKMKVLLNDLSLEEALGSKAAHVLVLHEVFGIQGIERNNSSSSQSAYMESIKVWDYINVNKRYELSSKKVLNLEGGSALSVCEIIGAYNGYSFTQDNLINCMEQDFGYFDLNALEVCKTIARANDYAATQSSAILCLKKIRNKFYHSGHAMLCHKIAKKDDYSSTQGNTIKCLIKMGKN